MPEDDLCPYCRDKDLSGVSTFNKERHYEKCRKRNPYPKTKPRKQTKLGFLPLPKPTEPSEPQNPDFQITSSSETLSVSKETDSQVSPLVDEGDNITIPDLGDDDEDDDLSAANGNEENHNLPNYPLIDINNNDDIVLVGEVASNGCKGFEPLLAENFYENFAFQLLPTMPHITLCGSSFHHVSCTNAHFELQPGSEDMVNTQCSSLKSDEKLSQPSWKGAVKTSKIFTPKQITFSSPILSSVKNATH